MPRDITVLQPEVLSLRLQDPDRLPDVEVGGSVERVPSFWVQEPLKGSNASMVLRKSIDGRGEFRGEEVGPLPWSQSRAFRLKTMQKESSSGPRGHGVSPAEDKCDTTIWIIVHEILLMIVGQEGN